MTAPDATYFDQWYADMVGSPVKDEIQQRRLGLPPELLSTSLLPWDGIADVAAALEVKAGDTLLDLACGRGGYGLEVAARTGARLVGVDFSAEAIRQANELAARRGQTADFRVGDLTSTGLTDAAVDAVLCVDAIQFAVPRYEAYLELRRVLRPGGHVVLTNWEPVERGEARLPERLRDLDLQAELHEAGFVDVQVRERPDWRAQERGMWEEAAALDPGDDPALQSLHAEAARSLATWDLLRRVVATAQRPAP